MNNNGTRAFLYVSLAAFGAAGTWLVDAPDAPTWRQWATLIVSAGVSGLASLRAYLDGSAERSRQAVAISPDGWQPAPPSKLPLWLALALLPICLTGCKSSYPATATVAITAEKAMESWAAYFDAAQANPDAYGTDLVTLWTQRAAVDDAWETYRAAMNLADDARQDYLSGLATDAAALAALKAARENSVALVHLVQRFIPRTTP